MKKMLLPVLGMMMTVGVMAQDSSESQKIEKLVSEKTFVFRPQTAMPQGGGSRQLSYGFELKIARDRIVAYLPYFGRAYSAPMDPSKGGIDFSSNAFDYTVSERKSGGWNISIKPKDVSDVQQMTLTISETGSTNLMVNSNNRQPISFTGEISK